MNRYLVKLGSLDEKRAYPGNFKTSQNSPKRGCEGFEGPLSSTSLRPITPHTGVEPIPRREMAAGFSGLAQSDDPYAYVLAALRATCPAYVPEDRWRQAIADATSFSSEWGGQAQAFGWTVRELFGLHTPPERPAANYGGCHATTRQG